MLIIIKTNINYCGKTTLFDRLGRFGLDWHHNGNDTATKHESLEFEYMNMKGNYFNGILSGWRHNYYEWELIILTVVLNLLPCKQNVLIYIRFTFFYILVDKKKITLQLHIVDSGRDYGATENQQPPNYQSWCSRWISFRIFIAISYGVHCRVGRSKDMERFLGSKEGSYVLIVCAWRWL